MPGVTGPAAPPPLRPRRNRLRRSLAPPGYKGPPAEGTTAASPGGSPHIQRAAHPRLLPARPPPRHPRHLLPIRPHPARGRPLSRVAEMPPTTNVRELLENSTAIHDPPVVQQPPPPGDCHIFRPPQNISCPPPPRSLYDSHAAAPAPPLPFPTGNPLSNPFPTTRPALLRQSYSRELGVATRRV